jgi:hypothetical protein
MPRRATPKPVQSDYALTDDSPALPSDETASNSGSDVEEIPFRKAKAAAITAITDDSEEDDDDDEALDEYVVHQRSSARGFVY